ncbi:hypothetical protein GCM10009022_13500 [Vreelandella titanicae]
MERRKQCSFLLSVELKNIQSIQHKFEVSCDLGFLRKVGSQATVDARDAYHRSEATD